MTKQKFSILAGLVILLGASFFIYRDILGKKAATEAPDQGPPAGLSVSLPGGTQTQTNASLPQNSAQKPISVAMPDLSRALVFTTPLTDEVKAQIRVRFAEAVSNLKNNSRSLTDWINLGIIRKTIGDYDGARQAWEYANAVSPLNYVSFSNLGDLFHYYLKDYPKAEKNLKQAIKNEPSDIAAYRALSDLYTQSYKEKMSEAPKILSDGLAKNPGNYDLLILMASYYKTIGDKANAKIYYEKALAAADKAGMGASRQFIENEITNLSN